MSPMLSSNDEFSSLRKHIHIDNIIQTEKIVIMYLEIYMHICMCVSMYDGLNMLGLGSGPIRIYGLAGDSVSLWGWFSETFLLACLLLFAFGTRDRTLSSSSTMPACMLLCSLP